MRALIVFISILIASPCFSRPQSSDYANANPDEVEEDDNEPDDSLADEDDSRVNEQKPSVEPRMPLSRDNKEMPQDQYPLAEFDKFADYRQNINQDELRLPRKIFSFKKQNEKNDKSSEPKVPFSSPLNSRPSDEYTNTQTNIDADDVNVPQMDSQNSYNHDVNAPQDLSKVMLDKRTINFKSSLRDERDPSFENRNRESGVNNNGYINNEAMDTSEQERYLKQFYNTMQAENTGVLEEKSPGRPLFDSRDRRDIKPSDKDEASNGSSKDTSDKSSTDDDEAAIRRHIKRLTSDELEQLLNSLTDDKKELLKKIISESVIVDAGSVSKREITKKAGAVEENNLVESSQSDINKVQGDSISAETYSGTSMSTSSDSNETSKKPESFDISSSKPDTSKIENVDNSDDKTNKQFDNIAFSSNTEAKVSEMPADMPKKEGKREINYEENINYNDEEHSCPQVDMFSQFEDNDGEMQQEDSGVYKRETSLDNRSDFSNSMKSLEESFPNSNAYEDSAPYSGPLVRVKRDHLNRNIKKRSAALLPDAKVGYFPYKAENEDEDSDEGNEFDDEGFYDRNANFANNQEGPEEEVDDKSGSFNQPKRTAAYDPKSSIQNLDSDTMSIGSDTDSVLSGAEGVDDNLMYSSGTRNKRSANSNSVEDDAAKLSAAIENIKASDGNSFNCPHYQEIDAFGPLPRNYDVETGRYKRIRQVKQSHEVDD